MQRLALDPRDPAPIRVVATGQDLLDSLERCHFLPELRGLRQPCGADASREAAQHLGYRDVRFAHRQLCGRAPVASLERQPSFHRDPIVVAEQR